MHVSKISSCSMYDSLKFENVLFKETLCVNTINISPGIKLGLKINLPGTSDNGTLAMTLHFAIETVKLLMKMPSCCIKYITNLTCIKQTLSG